MTTSRRSWRRSTKVSASGDARINSVTTPSTAPIAIVGANSWDLGLKLLEDDNSAPTAGNAKVRIGHLAPFAEDSAKTLADVRLQNGDLLPGFDDVPYDVVADYIELAAGEYDLKITSADGSTTLIDPVPVTFNAGDIVSVLAVVDGTDQPLGVFALPSGAGVVFCNTLAGSRARGQGI